MKINPKTWLLYHQLTLALTLEKFLILDEPTNHLDIETKKVIEQSLSDFKGTLLLVSHDRFFVERVGITKIIRLKEGKLEPLITSAPQPKNYP